MKKYRSFLWMPRYNLLIFNHQAECHYVCVSNMSCIINVFRLKMKGYHIFSDQMCYMSVWSEANIELWWEQVEWERKKKYLCKYSSSDLSSQLSGNNKIKLKYVNLAVRLLLSFSVVKSNLFFKPEPFRKDFRQKKTIKIRLLLVTRDFKYLVVRCRYACRGA